MDKIVLVTGGNRGIGLEICRQLAEKGATVILTARDENKGAAARDALAKSGFSVGFQPLDVADSASIQALKNQLENEYGRLDVLINNAGIGVGNKKALDADFAEVKEIMATNFYGPWELTVALLPLLRKSKDARVINMSSGMGALDSLPAGSYAGYRLSKTSLNGLSMMLAGELGSENIAVNAMCPGWVRTGMGGQSAPRSVEQGADTAAWLALEASRKITGKFFRDRKEIPW